jgi:hypothetical protein
MDAEMFGKAIESIHEFGFVDPVTVREVGADRYQIVDGEHRWKAALEHSDACDLLAGAHTGFDVLSVWNLGLVEDDVAQQLTIVLNETRGEAKQDRLAALVQGLAERNDERRLRTVMPFTAERFAELSGARGSIDWEALQRKRRALAGGQNERWVERVYRMPKAAAEVVDEAIAKVKDGEGVEQDWRALEMIAADFLGSP